MKKLCTKILIAAIILLTSLEASAGVCLVLTESDMESDTALGDPDTGSSATDYALRTIIEDDMNTTNGGCDITGDDFADNSVAANLIEFDTPIYNQFNSDVENITLNKDYGPIRLNSSSDLIIGNYSNEAITSSTDEASYNQDDTGYVRNSDDTIKDAGYVIIDNQSFLADGESITTDNLASLLPFKCKEGAADVYLRNMILLVPNGVTETDVMGLDCLKDGGDLHFCDGELNKDSDGKIIDPNSGDDWCAEYVRPQGECEDGGEPDVTVYQDSDGDGYGCIETETTPVSRGGRFSGVSSVVNKGISFGSGAGTFKITKPTSAVGSLGLGSTVMNGGIKIGNVGADVLRIEAMPCQTQVICEEDATPAGYSLETDDCDDSNAAVNPGAAEGTVCDEIDNDCDNEIDEGLECPEVADDADGDGYTEDTGDCDDTNASVYTGAIEVTDGVDNDCDGTIDETVTEDCTDTVDNDSDGAIDCDDTADCSADAACTAETDDDADGFTESAGDCDDTNAAINPAATEVCDDVDNDCDSETDEGLECTTAVDVDLDGFDTDTDCNDADASINPQATEVCFDEIDQNCSGEADEGCAPEVCDDTVDNDLDGTIDCDDEECAASFYLCNNVGPEEECSDGVDNDEDEYTDCEDADCYEDLACTATFSENCSDGVDNNLDGLEDCQDPTCTDFDLGDGTTCADAQVTDIGDGYYINGGGGCGCDLTAAGVAAANPAQIIAGLMTFLSMLGLRARAKE